MAEPTESKLRIGQVRKLLASEFPGLSISKVRFLEDRELIQPERTPGGYRLYSRNDIEQLRQILRMQRDEFLPLRVIREELQRRLAQGGSRNGATATTEGEPVSLEDLCGTLQVAPAFVAACQRMAILPPDAVNDDGTIGAEQAAILTLIARLTGAGVDLEAIAMLQKSAQLQIEGALRSKRVESADAIAATVGDLVQRLIVQNAGRRGEELSADSPTLAP